MRERNLLNRIITLLLFLFSLLFVFPAIFLAVGSLMGERELADLLEPVLEDRGGYASWKLFPLYPTLKNYVEVLLDSPEFFVMFWNSVKITVGVLMGQLLAAVPAAWGFAKFSFPGKKLLLNIYIALMLLPFQVTMLGNYLLLDRLGLLDTLMGIVSVDNAQEE